MPQRRVLPLVIGLFAAALVQPAEALDIQFDYSLDSGNFFTPERRATLEQVASIFENNLSNTFAARNNLTFALDAFTDEQGVPISGSGLQVSHLNLAADTMRFYVNAGALGTSMLGQAYVGTAVSGYGSLIFNSSLLSVADLYPPEATNVSPAQMQRWTFDSDIRNYETPVPVQTSADIPGNGPVTMLVYQDDFATVAMHELGHVFGLSHSANSGDTMAPDYQGSGSRTLFTTNDWGAMIAQGWQVKSTSPDLNQVVTVVPEPGSVGLMAAGVWVVGFWRRRRD